MLNIVHLTTVHPAFDVRIFFKEARTLAQRGYKVTLIAQHEKSKTIDGVNIVPLPKPKRRLSRIMFLQWLALYLAIRKKGDIYQLHDPELIIVGLILKLLGKKVIFDVHEDITKQILNKEWIPKNMRKIVSFGAGLAELLSAYTFDQIVVATPSIMRHYPGERTTLIQNFPILGELSGPCSLPYRKRPLQLAYIGGITELRGIKEMVRAMALLPKGMNARLVIAGSFEQESLEEEIRFYQGNESLDFLGWQDRESVSRILGRARAGLVIFHPIPNHMEAQPNKLFEYMSAGIPVIASDFPLWRKIIARERCGILVDPLDAHAIAEAIQWIFENPEEAEAMGLRGKEAVSRYYNWDVEAEKLLSLYASISARAVGGASTLATIRRKRFSRERLLMERRRHEDGQYIAHKK